MIGLDTNVLIRYFAQDDAVQSPIAARLIDRLTSERPGYVSSVVLAETSWVLSRVYKKSRADIAAIFENLLRSREIVVENAAAAYRAVGVYQSNAVAEYADALIAELAACAGCTETVTFDKSAAKGAGMRLLA